MSTSLTQILERQRFFFNSGVTLEVDFRQAQLRKLQKALGQSELALLEALQLDFQKCEFEGQISELLLLQLEIKKHLKFLDRWTRPKRVRASWLNFPSKDYIYAQPYGLVLIIAPWNYPVLLALQPLVSAIAAGNCAVIKPSELAPHTAAVIQKLIADTFDAEHVDVVLGGVAETQDLLKHRFDKIFFTGSTAVGKIVQQAAAVFLTPTVLELGGKSPCIVTASANLDLAAKRIAYGKWINAGQTCIAPDFVWIHHSVLNDFIDCLTRALVNLYGRDIQSNPDFPRVINDKNWQRLAHYLIDQPLVLGGVTDRADLYISPTVVVQPSWDHPLMTEEIFGPILPIQTFDDWSEILTHNQVSEKPLALYVFSSKISQAQAVMSRMQFGGGCINDVLVHIVNDNLPFGGFGASGTGHYHGKFGFDAFSHSKSVVLRRTWLDIPLKYPPYKSKSKWFKYLLKRVRS